MLTGMVAGFLLRRHRLKGIQHFITILIWLLLFLLGVEVGGNKDIIQGLHTIGLEAILLTIGGALSSVTAAKLLWHMLNRHKKAQEQTSSDATKGSGNLQALKGSLVIVIFFVLGIISSLFHILPAQPGSHISFYALCALMTSVGISVGNDPQTLKNFRTLNPRLIFLPVMTIAGTLAGTAVISLLLRANGRVSDWDSPQPHRLPGHRFRLRLLLTVEHLHHRIPRSRTGHHSPADQHQPRNHYPTGSTATGTLVRASGTHFGRRCHHNGHHASHHHPHFGTRVCRSVHLPRVHGGLQCTIPRNVVLFTLKAPHNIHR